MKLLPLLLFLPILLAAQSPYSYTNLVMEGGGTRGIAYAGVLNVLEEKGVLQNIENVGGSSAGSIAGMLVSLGYQAAEIDSIIFELPLQQFNDGRWGLLGKYKRFRKDFGMYKGETFEDWLHGLVAYKTGNPDLTFAQLHQLRQTNKTFRTFSCTGTNLSRQRLEVFSYKTTPDMPVALAVRISGGIPIYFEPVALDDDFKKVEKDDTSSYVNYFVDGGMLCNYPICLFDTCLDNCGKPLQCEHLQFNQNTIGIKLERPQQIDSIRNNNTRISSFRINNVNEYMQAFSNLLLETLNRRYPQLENEAGRTIYVSQGEIPARIRKTSAREKQLLYDNGVEAANTFFFNAATNLQVGAKHLP